MTWRTLFLLGILGVCFAAPSALAAEESPVRADAENAEEPASDPGAGPDSGESSPIAQPAEPFVLPDVLDLHAARQLAIASNPSLKAAEARVKQGKARLWQARSAWFPQIDVSATASKTWLAERDYSAARDAASGAVWGPVYRGAQQALAGGAQASVQSLASFWTSGLSGTPLLDSIVTRRQVLGGIAQSVSMSSFTAAEARRSIDDSVQNYRVSLTASWLLFNGFERKFVAAQARFGWKETQEARKEAARLLLSAVTETYYSAQLAREGIGITEADKAFNERLLKEAKARRAVGTGSLSEELNFQVARNAAQAELIRARLSYHQALIGLAELMALPASIYPGSIELAPLDVSSPDLLEEPDEPALLARANGGRPEVALGEYTVKRAEAGVGASRAAFYPTVAAQISRDATRSNSANADPTRSNNIEFREEDFSTTVGLNLSYSLFAGGRDLARLREAKAYREEAERSLEQTTLSVTGDVRNAVADLSAAQELLSLENENAQYVQKNRDLVDRGYSEGVLSLVRLNEAQRDLVAAQASLALARVSLLRAWERVRIATGEILAAYGED